MAPRLRIIEITQDDAAPMVEAIEWELETQWITADLEMLQVELEKLFAETAS